MSNLKVINCKINIYIYNNCMEKNISLPYVTKKEYILGVITTPIQLLFFATSLVIADIIAKIVGLFSKEAVNTVFRWESNTILYLLKFVSGAKFFFNSDKLKNLPKDKPIILVSNHQSLYDIAIHNLFLKKHRIVYVAKKELGKWLPTVAVCLKAQKAALIDRGNPKQSVLAIKKMGQRIENEKRAVCIFSEGTRARDGKLKEFKDAGIKTLLKYAPDAIIVPVAIDGSWKTFAYKYFPVPFGIKLFAEYLDPINAKDCDINTITETLHDLVDDKIKEFRGEK